MKVTRISMASGKQRTWDLDITPEQIDRYNNGALVQDAFPNLTASEREFILTGMTDAEWDYMFSDDEGEDYDDPAF